MTPRPFAAFALAASILLAPFCVVRLLPWAEAQQPIPQPSASPAVVADEPKPANPWKKTLPGGMTAELLGVGFNIWEAKKWWTPDGLLLDKVPPGISSYIPAPPDVYRDVAVRVTNVPDGTRFTWKVSPSGYPSFSLDGISEVDDLGNVERASLHFAPDLTKFTLRFGIASGPWQTMLTANENGQVIQGIKYGDEVMFSRPRDVNGQTSIVVSDTIKSSDAFRLVAIDRDGQIHETVRGNTSSNIYLRLFDKEFDLPLGQIEKFEFQSRPYDWAEFPDVPINPKPTAPAEPKSLE
jgi:hypothetical protein